MANRDKRRRGRSRKRRPAGGASGQTPARAAAVAPAPRATDSSGRPAAPWHPLPLAELLILVGAVAVVVSLFGGGSPRIPVLLAGIAAVLIGTLEVTVREHMSGYRSHALLLALLPTFVFHSLAVLLVVLINGSAPIWVNVVLVPFDVLLFSTLFKLLRARFQDARREQVFGGR